MSEIEDARAFERAVRRLEALVFASPEPVPEALVAARIPDAAPEDLIAALAERYEGRGVVLRRVADGVQMVTAPDCADVLIERTERTRRLSRAALETLAVIAYHQPCSRPEIEEVRGVALAKGSLDRLIELGWVAPRGRKEAPGRPLLYGTTPAFLEQFGLPNLGALPGRADLQAAGLLDAQLPSDFLVPRPRDEEPEDEREEDA